jgi:nucleoside-diphosphate-sugar epimerase
MKVLIIGGTGLISTTITRELLERGDDVTLYNRGRSDASVPIPSGWKALTGDRTDYAVFEAQMHAAGTFDCVMDMVGYLPGDAESAVRGFKGRVGHFIFCSTVDVYDKPAARYPYREDEPLSGLGTYATHKVACERILSAAHERGDFPLTIIRPAYTYGEGRGPVHSFGGSTRYLDRIRKGKPIVVHGDGNSLWVACHRDDVAHAFVAAAGQPRTYGKAYHVTGEEWMTWNQYHQQVALAMGAPAPQRVHIPSDLLAQIAPQHAGINAVNFQFNNIFDNSAAHADLDFRYTVKWADGVRRMVAWLDQRNRIEDSAADPYEDRLIAAWRALAPRLPAEDR